MKTFLWNGIYLVLLLAFFSLDSVKSRADIVYVWSNDGTIQKFATNGIATLMATGFDNGWGPVGLACDNVGNLYAGHPNGSSIRRFSPDGSNYLIGPIIDSVSGLAFDSGGNLFAAIPNWGEIAKLEYDGWYVLLGNSTNRATSNLSSPVGLAFDSVGNFFAVNNTNGRTQLFPVPSSPYDNTIQKFSPSFTSLGAYATNLNQPWGLAFDSDGNLFVANSGTNGTLKNTVVKFATNGVRSTFATSAGGLSSPQGLAFDSAGNLYVANGGNGTITKFTTNGAASVFASGLNLPTSIAIFPGQNVWSATKIKLNDPKIQPDGALQFDFRDNAGLTFTVFSTTNLALAFTNWTALGGVTEVAPGSYQFTDPTVTNNQQRYYRVRSP